ncbi:8713_t:CDS:1, partial [Cetraspora pellucida]
MVGAIEAWSNRVQYYQTDSLTLLSSEIPINAFEQIMNNAIILNYLPTFTIFKNSTTLEKLKYNIIKEF